MGDSTRIDWKVSNFLRQSESWQSFPRGILGRQTGLPATENRGQPEEIQKKRTHGARRSQRVVRVHLLLK